MVLLTQMPLTHQARGVAGRFQTIGERLLGQGQPLAMPALVEQRRIELMPKPLLVATREQPSPRGAAIGTRDIAIAAPDAVTSQRVDVRCGNLPAAMEADIGVTKVVGQQNHDIRGLGRGRLSNGRRGKQQTGDSRNI